MDNGVDPRAAVSGRPAPSTVVLHSADTLDAASVTTVKTLTSRIKIRTSATDFVRE